MNRFEKDMEEFVNGVSSDLKPETTHEESGDLIIRYGFHPSGVDFLRREAWR